MGLAVSPSYMVQLMHSVMAGLEWSICCVYMDDILIWANDFEELCDRLEMVLARLSGSGLTLKAKKCEVMLHVAPGSGRRSRAHIDVKVLSSSSIP